MSPAFATPYAPTASPAVLALRRQCARPTRVTARPCTRRAPPPPACVWVEKKASVPIEASPQACYDVWVDLEAMPKWSPWLRDVQVDEQDPLVSDWTLAARGMTVVWKARMTSVIPGELIAWSSMTGLTNKGRVTFARGEQGSSCTVTLAINFDVPAPLARAFDFEFIGQFVERTLLADLKRFRSVALTSRRQTRRQGAAAASASAVAAAAAAAALTGGQEDAARGGARGDDGDAADAPPS